MKFGLDSPDFQVGVVNQSEKMALAKNIMTFWAKALIIGGNKPPDIHAHPFRPQDAGGNVGAIESQFCVTSLQCRLHKNFEDLRNLFLSTLYALLLDV